MIETEQAGGTSSGEGEPVVQIERPPRRSHRGLPRRDGALGARLRRVRERQGLSLGTVAALLNVPREQLERIEAGRVQSGPAVERVERWLAVPGR